MRALAHQTLLALESSGGGSSARHSTVIRTAGSALPVSAAGMLPPIAIRGHAKDEVP